MHPNLHSAYFTPGETLHRQTGSSVDVLVLCGLIYFQRLNSLLCLTENIYNAEADPSDFQRPLVYVYLDFFLTAMGPSDYEKPV